MAKERVVIMKHCCEVMEYSLEEDREIRYNPYHRSYGLVTVPGDYDGKREILNYCPWCGVKFPEELSNKWQQILLDEYKIASPYDKDKNKVPPEFWTDVWWKKLGL